MTDTSKEDSYHLKLSDLVRGVLGLIPGLVRSSKAIPLLNQKNEFLSLGSLIEQAANDTPKQTFIKFEDQQISYKEFNHTANKVAHFLNHSGLKKGDVIVLLMENRPEYLIYACAIVKLGAIASLVNPSQSGQGLTHSVNLVKPKAIIVGEENLAAFDPIKPEIMIESDAFYFAADQDLKKGFGETPEGYKNLPELAETYPIGNLSQTKLVHRKDSCFYIYTSGTTGMPKASITNHDRWITAHAGFGHVFAQLTTKDVFYCTLPFYHATAMLICWGTIIAGRSTLLLRRNFSASEFWQDVEKHEVTAFGYVGELCRYLLNQERHTHDKNNNIRLVVGNGLRPSAWVPFKKRFGINKVVEFYGASEGNVFFVNFLNLNNTIGMAGPNTALIEYDKTTEKPMRNDKGFLIRAKKGKPGLLLGKINNISPFPGYTDKNQTKKAIVENAFSENDKWFNTGDLVREIGFRHYQFVDRLGDTYRWKGENVSTTEVENIIMQNDAVADCTVYGVEIPATNGRAGMIVISPANETDLNLSDLYAYFTQHIPAYAIPRFVRLKSSIDTTGTFKHKKSDLKEQAYDPGKTDDDIYVWLPKTEHYQALDQTIYTNIQNSEYPF